MTEGGLLSNVTFKTMAAENFVCVRLFTTALGGGKAQIRKFLPGISEELCDRLMFQGNALVVITPDGRIVTTPNYEAVEQTKDLKESDVQMNEKIPEGILDLRQVMKNHPARGETLFATPWQFSPAHAFVVSWDDNRRIVAVPSKGGNINPSLKEVLSNEALLKRFQSRYVFVKIGTGHEPPREIQMAIEKAGETGVVILDIPETNKECFGKNTEKKYTGAWPTVRDISPGPHTVASLKNLLGEHYIDLPTYITQKTEKRRREGRKGRTGHESFEELWRSAPASVRRRWTEEQYIDMMSYADKSGRSTQSHR